MGDYVMLKDNFKNGSSAVSTNIVLKVEKIEEEHATIGFMTSKGEICYDILPIKYLYKVG